MTSAEDQPSTRTWARPVPVVGDATSASERAADPTGWAFPGEARDALYAVIDARRDIRRYRPDPVPKDALERCLTAAHHGPSVGHSQPWRFVIVTEPTVRDRAAVLADRERMRQAAQLEPDAARRLLDLQLEGIREAPLGVVVCCDRRAPAAGVLGRATFPDTDIWSCACAIQNMWLAARAEGLGMGWVTLFRPSDLAELLDLPDGVTTLGWLCLGWPDERPPEPGLVRAAWSRRLPLDDVVLNDRWPSEGPSPAPPPSLLRAPDQHAVVAVRDGTDRLLTAPGSLGILDRAVDRIIALGHPHPGQALLLIAAADHPVTAHGVSAYAADVTREIAEATLAGESVGAALARQGGLAVRLVDAGICGSPLRGGVHARPAGPRGDLVHDPGLLPRDVDALLDAGGAVIGEAADNHGMVACGEIGIGNTTIAAALTCGLLELPLEQIVGLGAGSDSATLDRKRHVVGAAVTRARRARGDLAADPLRALSELGGGEIALLVGAILGAAERRVAVVLDGMAVSVAALVAVRLQPAAQAVLVAGQRSRERGHELVLAELGCEPLLDVRIRAGEGAGAVLASSLLRTAIAARSTTARVDH